jgi:polar amino acid transport system permease protein
MPGWRRFVGGGAFALFWAWLVVRWVHDWFVAPSGEPEPFVPVGPFETANAVAKSLAASLGPFGLPFDWLAGLFAFAAGAIPSLPALAQGAWLTVVLTVVGIALGFVLAVPLSVARVYGGRALRWTALSFTELIRGTPLLAQLFVLYYGTDLTLFIRNVPGVGVGVVPDQAVWVAIIGFTINSAAYQAEYIRSALTSVGSGQLTAARAVGLTQVEGIRYVVLPQALRYAIPGWTNELIYLIEYSSLATFTTVGELFNQTESIANETYRYTELFVTAGLFYLALVLSASLVMNKVEDWTAIPGIGQSGSR